VSGTATGDSQTVNIYAQLSVGQYAPAESYNDTGDGDDFRQFRIIDDATQHLARPSFKACTVTSDAHGFWGLLRRADLFNGNDFGDLHYGTAYQAGLDAGHGSRCKPSAIVAWTGPSSSQLKLQLVQRLRIQHQTGQHARNGYGGWNRKRSIQGADRVWRSPRWANLCSGREFILTP